MHPPRWLCIYAGESARHLLKVSCSQTLLHMLWESMGPTQPTFGEYEHITGGEKGKTHTCPSNLTLKPQEAACSFPSTKAWASAPLPMLFPPFCLSPFMTLQKCHIIYQASHIHTYLSFLFSTCQILYRFLPQALKLCCTYLFTCLFSLPNSTIFLVGVKERIYESYLCKSKAQYSVELIPGVQ